MILKCDQANCCVILQNESVVKILNFIEHNNKVSIIGLELGNGKKENLFDSPLQSSKLGIYSVNISRGSRQRSWPISDVKCKAVCLPWSSKKDFPIFPLNRKEY